MLPLSSEKKNTVGNEFVGVLCFAIFLQFFLIVGVINAPWALSVTTCRSTCREEGFRPAVRQILATF